MIHLSPPLFSEEISFFDPNICIPECPTASKPKVGMVFEKLEDGISFYKNYALLEGFDIRLGTSTKSPDGVNVWKYILCSREGHKHAAQLSSNAPNKAETTPNGKNRIRRRVPNRTGCRARVIFRLCGSVGYKITSFEERHNHPMLSSFSRPFLKINRNVDIGHQKFMLNCAKANIGTMKSFRLFKESVGGYNNIGTTAIDFKNFKRDLKAYVAGGDAQMIIDKMFRRQETCPTFRFAYDVDETDQLTRLFWCDPVARKNRALFGDVLSFDATYETNRINSIAEELLGDITPEQDDDGYSEVVKISFKEAYNHCRPHYSISLSDKHNWDNLQPIKSQLFLWKVNYKLLPFPENITHIYNSLPYQCPNCLKDDGSMDHCLLHCPMIHGFWNELALILDGPTPTEGITLQQHILEWNMRSSNSFKGKLRLIAPGIIAWSIWKNYASNIFGNQKERISNIKHTIQYNIYLWCWKFRRKKWMIKDTNLTDEGLQYFALTGNFICNYFAEIGEEVDV
ncbi:hypothetical protein DM860_009692 [Cuscuta australis]|uniref:Uncharacterized protein n=1 Tax=Cuscuta australis TaxID=267555 RepID=A0A328DMG9_9ASTE|nr:hypothetical protein DM860_009692 [Cuscuta australis]